MNNILELQTKKYLLKLDNFEGPLDLLCHLVDKNKMDINKISLSAITDQYIEYINAMQELNLDITSEFLVMASTLLYIKSKSLLPKVVEDEGELTEEELLNRIIEYKKYKEICKELREQYLINSKRFYKLPDQVELPKRKIEEQFEVITLADIYKQILEKRDKKMNKEAARIEKIAIGETVTVASKVKDIFRELLKKPKVVFNKMCTKNKYNKLETVTAFTGVLELSRRRKINTQQEEIFGDIILEKNKVNKF